MLDEEVRSIFAARSQPSLAVNCCSSVRVQEGLALSSMPAVGCMHYHLLVAVAGLLHSETCLHAWVTDLMQRVDVGITITLVDIAVVCVLMEL